MIGLLPSAILLVHLAVAKITRDAQNPLRAPGRACHLKHFKVLYTCEGVLEWLRGQQKT